MSLGRWFTATSGHGLADWYMYITQLALFQLDLEGVISVADPGD